jgi:DNA mismatch endonuclease (patch repair protein)
MKIEVEKRKFLRDGRAPIPAKSSTSRVMSANRGKSTTPELLLRKSLSSSGLRGYRLNWRKAPGTPDIAFVKNKTAIFVNGCFWHRCPYCKPKMPKTHARFWANKFSSNKKRDKAKRALLAKNGWKVFTFWECQVKSDPQRAATKIRLYLEQIAAP